MAIGEKGWHDDRCAIWRERRPDLFDECQHKENGRPRGEPWHDGAACRHWLGQRGEGSCHARREGRGADIAVNRGGGETNDMVIEEERQGVGESSGG